MFTTYLCHLLVRGRGFFILPPDALHCTSSTGTGTLGSWARRSSRSVDFPTRYPLPDTRNPLPSILRTTLYPQRRITDYLTASQPRLPVSPSHLILFFILWLNQHRKAILTKSQLEISSNEMGPSSHHLSDHRGAVLLLSRTWNLPSCLSCHPRYSCQS